VKLRGSARILKCKAIFSVRVSVGAFNGLNDDGRPTAVLLHLQHAFEMLLKAALRQKRVPVFDKVTGRSIGFESAIRQAQQPSGIKLTEEEAGTLRAIDAMRDDEQHWYNEVDEGILYVHARAAITLINDLLQRVFDEHLAEPAHDFDVLVDREYQHAPATRRRLVKVGGRVLSVFPASRQRGAHLIDAPTRARRAFERRIYALIALVDASRTTPPDAGSAGT
jgi:hypothetical protein